jgi:hypothetical protein
MFIIEGPDNVGKTTLAKRAVELAVTEFNLPARYSHMSKPSALFNFSTHYRDMMSYYAVQDRFHLGALAYHPEGTLKEPALRWIEGELLRRGSFVLLVLPGDMDWYRKRIIESGRHEMFRPEGILEAARRFEEIADDRVAHYDAISYVDVGGFTDDNELREWLGIWADRVNFARLANGEREMA